MTQPVSPPQPVSVTGGSHGITADCKEIVALAARFGAAAADSAGAAVTLHGYLAAPAVAGSAVFDPVGFAHFELELLGALDGWRGLSWAGVECGVLDGELRLAASAYSDVDRVSTQLKDVVVGALGFAPALGAGAAVLGRTGDAVAAAQAVVASDPEVADVVVTALGLPALLTTIGRRVPDGRGVIRHAGTDRRGVAGRPPRRLTDILRNLSQRNGDAHHGEIDVRIMTRPDGTRRVIVDITGTKSWDPLPTRDVTSLTTNGRALVGQRTAYEDGVLLAMRRAGVRSSDKVMLVGHSEGGMVAVTTARDTAASGEFDVTHVITAGSPIGRTAGSLPGRIKLLALENKRDVVPHLDGLANPDRPNVLTATSKEGDGTVLGDHDIGRSYVPLAADVENSRDASVRDYLGSAKTFFQATSVETHTYQVQRQY
jgi:pimeloyl-ACP methyl ester carboxylesterase